MSNIWKYIKLPLVIIATFFVQVFVSNSLEIFGVTPNVILVTVVIVAMWNEMWPAVICACILGIGADFIFHFDIGLSFISYLIIAVAISYISKKYRKDSKAAIVYITIMATSAFAFFEYIYYGISNGALFNVFAVFKQTIIEILLNIALAYILYKVFEKSMKKRELDSFYM